MWEEYFKNMTPVYTSIYYLHFNKIIPFSILQGKKNQGQF